MRYLGGKSKIGKKIAEVILKSTPRRELYVEPFFGGGGSFLHLGPSFTECIVSDVHEDLMLMWQAMQNGWSPPTDVTEDEYKFLRDAEPSALRGFVGFACSFSGKWFNGYARGESNGIKREWAAESARNCAKIIRSLNGATVTHKSFFDLTTTSNAVAYLDPPYASTTGYANTFDHVEFWKRAKSISEAGAHVFVSEYAAPNDWTCIAEFERRKSAASANKRTMSTERLFVHSSQVAQLAS